MFLQHFSVVNVETPVYAWSPCAIPVSGYLFLILNIISPALCLEIRFAEGSCPYSLTLPAGPKSTTLLNLFTSPEGSAGSRGPCGFAQGLCVSCSQFSFSLHQPHSFMGVSKSTHPITLLHANLSLSSRNPTNRHHNLTYTTYDWQESNIEATNIDKVSATKYKTEKCINSLKGMNIYKYFKF